MPTPPTDLPRWADNAAAGDIVDPPATKKDVGWDTTGEKPPRTFFNWFWNLVYQWTAYLSSEMTLSKAGYADVVAFLDDTTVPIGGLGRVNPPAGAPWSAIWEKDILPSPYVGALEKIAANERYVAAYVRSVSGSPTLNGIHIFNATTGVEESYSPIAIPTLLYDICTDGVYFYTLETGSLVRKYDPADGSLVASQAVKLGYTGAQIPVHKHIVTDGSDVYVAGQTVVAAGSYVIKLPADLSTSTPTWTHTDNENNRVWGDLAISPVWIGVTSTDNTTRRITILNKGTGTALYDLGPDSALYGIAMDGDSLYFSSELRVYRSWLLYDTVGYGQETSILRNNMAISLCVDPVYMGAAYENYAADEGVWAVSKKDDAVPSFFDGGQAVSSSQVAHCVATNGQMAFIGGQTVTSANQSPYAGSTWCLRAIRLPSSTKLLKKTSATDPLRKYPNILTEPQHL